MTAAGDLRFYRSDSLRVPRAEGFPVPIVGECFNDVRARGLPTINVRSDADASMLFAPPGVESSPGLLRDADDDEGLGIDAGSDEFHIVDP